METLGTLVVPGYDIETRVGGGRSGEVFRVRHVDSGDIQALKVSHPSPRHGPEELDFKLEYHLHSRLRHPHIIHSHRFGEIDEYRRYYTMDYVETVPLAHLYREHGIRALADVALAVCSALEYAHAQGTLHGDIKPANMLVSSGAGGRIDRVLLADFGHARRIGQETQSSVQGTLAYLAPEEINGWRIDARSDLYSFGVTLFEAVAGRLPYPASTPRELFEALMELRPPSLRESAPELDPRWAQFLDSLIARNPEERPRSATAAAERIAELLGRTLEPASARADAGSFFGATLTHLGRQEELQRVARLMHDPGPVRAVLVTGDEGIGKTRFAEEFARTVELEGGKVYRSDARGEDGTGFRLLRRVRRGASFVDLTNSERGGPEGGSDGGSPRPHQKRAELERLVDSLLADQESMDAECLYVFDSVECADLDSLAFLRALQGRLAGSKSLLMLVGQPGAGEPVLDEFRGPEAIEIRLAPFDESELRDFLLAHLGGGRDDPGAPLPLDDVELGYLATWMTAHARGNPRLIESSLRSLARHGHLARRGSAWALDRAALEERPLPLSARDRALEKLRQLPDEGRAYLELASACGPEFDASILAATEPFDADAASAFLTDALLSGILVRAPGESSRYRFADPEAGRALYETLEESTRRTLHLRIADRMEASSTTKGRVEVADHLARAGERERARDAFSQAAVANGEAGAFQEAGRCFRKAWELHTRRERSRTPAFAPEWVRTLYTNSQYEEAVGVADEVLAGVDPETSGAQISSLLVWKAICLGQLGQRDEGQRVLRSLLESGQPIDDPRLEALALTQFGIYEAQANRRDSAREHLLRAREIALREGLPYEMGKAELNLGVLCWREDDPDTALEWHARAHDHLVQAEGDDLLPAVWGNQAICHWFLLDARRAASYHRKAADGYLRQHRRSEAARSYQNLAHVLTEMGHWVEAERALVAAEQLNRSLRGPRQASYFEYAKARLAHYRGRSEEAARHVDRALELAEKVDDTFVTCGHRCLLGLIELETGQFERAAETGEQTLVTAREIDYRFGIAKSLYLLGQATRQSGRPKQALVYLDDAQTVAEEANQPVVLFRIQLARAELLSEHGDTGSVERLLAECRGLQERCDSILWKGFLHLSKGKIRANEGHHERARKALAAAYETFAGLGAERLRAETLLHQARSHLALGSHHAARAAMRHARSIHQSLGLPLPASPFPEDVHEKDGSLHTVRRILETAASVSRDITTLQSVDEVLERILDVAITYLGTERGVVALADPDSGRLEVRFARNIDRESIADSLEISRSTLDSAGRAGEMIHTGDALADPQLSLHESVRRGRIRSLISLPIRWGEQRLGALYMDHRTLTDLFGREERLFLHFIADMAAIGIRNAREFEIREEAVRNLRGELEEDEMVFPGTVVGRGTLFRELIRRGTRGAQAGKVVLLIGPSGAGKDHIARIVHATSGLKGELVDCPLPTLPETLIEGELFGVARGAATYVDPRDGLAQAAQGGSLFLNEVGDLPLALQPKLLHFLERREFRKVGSTEVLRLDGLILCATNADLEKKVAEGSFREDLFYRMSECVLDIPPLREHPEDIPDLAELFLREFERKSGKARRVLHPLARDLLMRCPWEGNIRELKSCLSRAADETPSGMIEPHHLESPSLRRMGTEEQLSRRGGVREEVHLVEIRRIHEAMTRAGGIITRAAGILGLSEASLRRRIAKYQLENLILRPKRRSR